MAVVTLGDELEEIDLFGDGHFAYLHQVKVDQFEYSILYVPVAAGLFASEWAFEQQLGRRLPHPTYEIKFALSRDFDGGAPAYTCPTEWEDLGALNIRQMMGLGSALFQSSWVFRSRREVKGFVAIALEERPKLAAYYRRLLKKYERQLHFEVHLVDEGKGYAIL